MDSYNAQKIRDSFASFSKKNNFVYEQNKNLIAPAKSNLLFNISGGVIYQDELLGVFPAENKKVSSIQSCVRTDKISKIGYTGRHHLFFEMLGHFMFYTSGEKETKEEFIRFAYNFLTKELGLNKTRIYATVHPDDTITCDIWKKLDNKNIILNSENTFVQPYLDKSSLRTEILWQKNDSNKSLMELWNLVFTQFNSKEIFTNPSLLIAADSGGSLERLVTALENKNCDYDNFMWYPFVNDIMSESRNKNLDASRRLADFTNTCIKLIDAGIKPGNKVQPYVLRKMLRIIFELCYEKNIEIDTIISLCLRYNDVNINIDKLLTIIEDELKKYNDAQEKGIMQAKKLIKKNSSVNHDYLKATFGLSDRNIKKLFK